MPIHKNTAYDIPFSLVNRLTGLALTGAVATIDGYRCLDGGLQESVSGTFSEIGNGQYLFEGLAADFNADYTTGLLFVADDAVPVHILLQMTYFRKDTAYKIPFLLINVSTSQGLLGASPSGLKCLDGSSQTSISGSFSELGHGQYLLESTTSDFGADEIAGFLITATNAVPIHLIIDLLESYTATDYVIDSPASVLATYITGQTIMTAPSAGEDWPLFISNLLDTPNNLGIIYDTTPSKDGRYMGSGEVFQHYGIEILIRSVDYETGWVKCNEIAGNLDSVTNTLVSKDDIVYKIHNVSRMGGVNSLGIEEGTKRRNMFSMNFMVSITKI